MIDFLTRIFKEMCILRSLLLKSQFLHLREWRGVSLSNFGCSGIKYAVSKGATSELHQLCTSPNQHLCWSQENLTYARQAPLDP